MRMSSKVQLGRIIKKAREDAELSQQQLADEIGKHVSYISRIERGKEDNPTREVLRNIAKLLNVKAEDLLGL
ncbi:hypothetical protein A3C59_04310 [Candidatus Daviesbacteria bacterium RIFCSPHIGHO2_02_FULL_36_13]|uniref:HTH cro/C1-type domain-containing protein n=1 Tax=Candidatus Daviesbacteria bacterium RIFCSPHIGHO2_02_FULL_36_13 TaxID=1797768 RepID=A0A1F5JW42_9BACT|nr:MAG: hypothetical protein A3C59_04310 [Candidatus Daviesbacteria bacterium RIFCSPHIGHO2_02_FULL_36_13]OGE42713.1 MAG: hypothetical protein A3A45_03210 [Candidatus Daviesbacteria bacterium RIFCSPLOWO2_01_FULL_36_8]